jgi:hypothetical protein
MPDSLFDVSRTTYPVSQQVITSTAIPIPTMPVYFIHSFEQPLCQEATCQCHAQQQEIVRLFVKIIEGHFELEKAANFIDDLNGERK